MILRIMCLVLVWVCAIVHGDGTRKIGMANSPSFSANELMVDARSRQLNDVNLEVKSVQRGGGLWSISVQVSNASRSDVYVLSDPVQANGETGPYVKLNERDDTILDLSILFYLGPPYFLYSNATQVRLLHLPAGASTLQTISVKLPVRATVPPYGNSLADARTDTISTTGIKTLNVSIGIVPDDDGVNELLRSKPFGPISNGGELINVGAYRGKSLAAMQRVVCASFSLNQ